MKWCAYQENCDHNERTKLFDSIQMLFAESKGKRTKLRQAERAKFGNTRLSVNGVFACIVSTQEQRTQTLLQSQNLQLKKLKLEGLLHSLSTLPRQNTPYFFTAYLSTKWYEAQNTHSPLGGLLLSRLKYLWVRTFLPRPGRKKTLRKIKENESWDAALLNYKTSFHFIVF